jgi:tRNA A-37 threonylcarbamoyl transferase component Bud32
MHEDTLAGYRIVRSLGSGSRSHVYLGQRGSLESETNSAVVDHNLVALKHSRRMDAPGTVSEAEALSLGAGEHIVQILDIATLVDQRHCLVLELLPGGPLSLLLDRRRTIDAGEAVTILAPLATALDSLHRSGVVHGKVRASAVLLRADGAPTFASFGDARLVARGMSPAELSASPGVHDDRRSLSELARTVLECVASPSAEAIIEWLVDSEKTAFSDNFGAECAERLFHWSLPSPIQFVLRPAPPMRSIVQLNGGEFFHTADQARVVEVELSAQQIRPPWLHSINLPDWVQSAVASTLVSLRANAVVNRLGRSTLAFVAALRTHLHSVRRRTWLLSAVAALSLISVTIALGVGDSESEPASRSGANNPSPEADVNNLRTTADEASAAVSGNDPLAALPELLRARERCLAELSVLCLDAVAQQGSTAMFEDIAAIRAMRAGRTPNPNLVATTIPVSSELVLIERLGGSALVGLPASLREESETASILMMRGEAGWLLRSYLPGN